MSTIKDCNIAHMCFNYYVMWYDLLHSIIKSSYSLLLLFHCFFFFIFSLYIIVSITIWKYAWYDCMIDLCMYIKIRRRSRKAIKEVTNLFYYFFLYLGRNSSFHLNICRVFIFFLSVLFWHGNKNMKLRFLCATDELISIYVT